jgi:hypothetical protein
MPLVQVDLPRALFAEKGTLMSDEIHQALVDSLAIPADDKFQVFRPRAAGELIFAGYGGVDRRDLIVIQVLMVHMYSVDSKREMYQRLVTRLSAIGIRPEDIQIAVTENGYEDWYAGRLHGE